VPALDGRMIQATPLKFCLKYRPPTIAVVYSMAKPSSSKNRKMRKYIHSITVDFTECIAPKGAKQRDLKPHHTTESL
jgi:hypothetical protein